MTDRALVLTGLLVIAFILGSIPFGLIIARLFKVNNLTERGSGNIGATNVSRVVGFWPAGFFTFLLDALKGAIATALATPAGLRLWTLALSRFESADPPEFQFGQTVIWLCGLFAVLGHCFSPWLRFKGGKGVATGLGVACVLSPLSALAGIIAFATAYSLNKISSLASIAGLLMAATCYVMLNPAGIHAIAGVALLFVILMRLEKNIDALLENREKPLQ